MNYLYPVRVGELSFTNTVPFRLAGRWYPMPCSSPRLLAQWAEEDRIDAGVIPVVDAWRLEDRFDPLGAFGIAVKRRARSVLLFSKRPWEELEGAIIGVTDQTSTSVQLLKLLMEVRDGFSVSFRDGFHPSHEARRGMACLARKPLRFRPLGGEEDGAALPEGRADGFLGRCPGSFQVESAKPLPPVGTVSQNPGPAGFGIFERVRLPVGAGGRGSGNTVPRPGDRPETANVLLR